MLEAEVPGVQPDSDPDIPDRLEDGHDAHSLGVLSVLPGSRVLDVGGGPGEVARRLRSRECRVWGLEIDPAAAESAKQWCERIEIADVEHLDVEAAFPEAPFDAIVCLDVLEHLKDPAAALGRLVALLAPGGRFVVSIPNVTHAAVRLQLLGGRFQTTDTGLLDRTHLHFFDRQAAESLLEGAGLTIIDRLRVRRGPTETEITVDLGAFPAETVAGVLADPDALTYQFVLVATTGAVASGAPVRSLAAALQTRLERTQDALEEATAYAQHLADELAAASRDRDAVAQALAEVEQQRERVEDRANELDTAVRERMAELEILHGELRHLQADLELKDAYALELRAQLAVAQEGAAQALALTAELGRVHAQVKIEADRRIELETELAAIKSRMLWRLGSRGERLLERHPVVRRVVLASTRRAGR